jgi:hypothetical protein
VPAHRQAGVAISLVLVAGCSSGSGALAAGSAGAAGAGSVLQDAGLDASAAAKCSAGPASGDFPCEVGAVIKSRCQPCHQRPPLNGAHFALLSYEDTRQPFGAGKLRFERMQQVIEPDFLPHMPPHGAAQPSLAELAILRAWLQSCALPAPEGAGCDTQEP